MKTLGAALLMLALAALPAAADDALRLSPADRIDGDTSVSAFLATALPGFGTSSQEPLKLPTVEGDIITVPGPIGIETVEIARTRVGDEPALALLAELKPTGEGSDGEQTPVMLAVVTARPPHRLIDAISASIDLFNGFSSPAVLSAGTAPDVLLINGTHHNSSQGFRNDDLYAIIDGKLVRFARIFTLKSQGCGYVEDQTPRFEALDGENAIRVTVHVETTIEATLACDLTPVDGKPRLYVTTFRWTGAAFEADNDAMERLAADNEAKL